jgi:hypothetical protein
MPSPMQATAAKVLATEAVVLAALWLLGRYFGS